jgi:cullin-4
MFTTQKGLDRRIIDGTCALIAIDREGKDLDRDTFKKAINLFHELKMYHSDFEPRMLELSQEYIAQWAERAAAEKSTGEYAEAALKLMNDELTRVDLFSLPGTTKRDLVTLMHDLLITKRVSKLSK